ncbi:HEAT repeat domain-containing protein [Singulisphaera rosea]
MRRFRLRLRTLLGLVVLVALALVGHRIYLDGPDAHWLLLKLRYGNLDARRSAVVQIRQSESRAWYHDVIAPIVSGPLNPQTFEGQRYHRRRSAALLIPALADAMKDPDAACRADALRALALLVTLHGSEPQKRLAQHQILAATHDREYSVRTAAVGSLIGLAVRDSDAVLKALRSALADPSLLVRQAATQELGMLGVDVPATQREVASILMPLLASREDSRVRVKAVWGMTYFGADSRRRPPGAGPDVVPALVAALRDPDVDVRRTAAIVLGSTTADARGRKISRWELRKRAIIPAMNASISDEDKAMREEAALALFAFGQRDSVVLELIEQAASNPARSQKSRFDSVLEEWENEEEDPGQKPADGDEMP